MSSQAPTLVIGASNLLIALLHRLGVKVHRSGGWDKVVRLVLTIIVARAWQEMEAEDSGQKSFLAGPPPAGLPFLVGAHGLCS